MDHLQAHAPNSVRASLADDAARAERAQASYRWLAARDGMHGEEMRRFRQVVRELARDQHGYAHGGERHT